MAFSSPPSGSPHAPASPLRRALVPGRPCISGAFLRPPRGRPGGTRLPEPSRGLSPPALRRLCRLSAPGPEAAVPPAFPPALPRRRVRAAPRPHPPPPRPPPSSPGSGSAPRPSPVRRQAHAPHSHTHTHTRRGDAALKGPAAARGPAHVRPVSSLRPQPRALPPRPGDASAGAGRPGRAAPSGAERSRAAGGCQPPVRLTPSLIDNPLPARAEQPRRLRYPPSLGEVPALGGAAGDGGRKATSQPMSPPRLG